MILAKSSWLRQCWHSALTSGINDASPALATRLAVVNMYSFIAGVAAAGFGITHLLGGATGIGLAEISLAALVLVNALALRFTRNVILACEGLLLSAVLLLVTLFTSGGIQQTGIFWFFVFPVAAFFLVGRAQGLLWVAFVYVWVLLLMVLGQLNVLEIPYSWVQTRQLLISLAVVTLGIYIYERTRELADATAIDLEADVTGSRRSLQEVQSKAEAIVENIGEAVVVIDGKGLVVLVNPAAEDVLGWSLGEMRGQPFGVCLLLRDNAGKVMAEETQPWLHVLRQGKTVHTTGQFKARDGHLFDTRLTVTPIIASGKVTGAIGAFRDITEERRVDRAKSEFVTLASHQLRTPIAAISWLSELLMEDQSLSNEQHDQINQIYHSNQRLANLVGQMLLLANLELGNTPVRPEPLNLGHLVKGIIAKQQQLAEADKKLTVKTYFDRSLGLVPLDEEITNLVVRHVIGNAFKYTPDGGNISIELAKGPEDVSLIVSDNGYGIPKRQHSKVFSKFFRAENIKQKDTDGNGLGLYVAKALLDYVGGSVSFDSGEQKGSTFIVSLPLTGMIAREPTSTASQIDSNRFFADNKTT